MFLYLRRRRRYFISSSFFSFSHHHHILLLLLHSSSKHKVVFNYNIVHAIKIKIKKNQTKLMKEIKRRYIYKKWHFVYFTYFSVCCWTGRIIIIVCSIYNTPICYCTIKNLLRREKCRVVGKRKSFCWQS